MVESTTDLPDTALEVTETALRAEGLRLLQPGRGFRFSLDALLLSDFASLRKRDRVLDLGCGCGVIGLILASRHPEIWVIAVEVQPSLAALARENVRRNQLNDRIRVIEGDLGRRDPAIPAGGFDHVVSNPPYRSPASGRLCLDSQEAIARHEILTDLGGVLDSARYALRPGGRISLIYPADRTAKLLSAMRKRRLEPKRITMVHPGRDAPARLILAEGCKDAGEEIIVTPPLLLDNEGNGTQPKPPGERGQMYGNPKDSGKSHGKDQRL
jgi:tRNA1Val (adenine37-N6)-methyltransferase